eukprot:854446-Pyramimonas_sp.AAC.1
MEDAQDIVWQAALPAPGVGPDEAVREFFDKAETHLIGMLGLSDGPKYSGRADGLKRVEISLKDLQRTETSRK